MDASEINDPETLRAWLETRPQSELVVIAHRVALRQAVKLYTVDSFRRWHKFGLTSVAVLRCLLVAGVAGHTSSLALKAAASSARAARASRETADADQATAHAIYAAAYAADAADSPDATFAAAFVATAAEFDAAAGTVADQVGWTCFYIDLDALQSNTNPLTLPIWHNSPPPD